MNYRADIHRVAVLGAGHLGSQIAAHLANAELDVRLFDLAVADADPRVGIRQAITRLADLRPAPLAAAEQIHRIVPATYQHDLQALRDCDLIVESVRENADCKQGLYARIAPYLHPQTIITSSTAGLSIDRLAHALPEPFRARFCGMQFFAPPRYRRLIELVAGTATDPRVLDRLEIFAVRVLGKGVVRSRDTPGFIANRIGLVALAAGCRHASRLELAPDAVDQLLTVALGAPERTIFGAIDALGPETFAQSLAQAGEALPDDPWLAALTPPDWLEALGRRNPPPGSGVYCREGDHLLVYDPARKNYRPVQDTMPATVRAWLDAQHPAEIWAALHHESLPQARFLRAWIGDMLHYSAVTLTAVAYSVRDVDLAMRWGFGLPQGPFELWQALGWRDAAEGLRRDIDAGRTLSPAPLPEWVFRIRSAYSDRGAYSPVSGRYLPARDLPVYRRWLFPPRPCGNGPRIDQGTVFQAAALRLWHSGDEIAVLDMPPRPAAFDAAALDAFQEALGIARDRFQALVLWYRKPWTCEPVALFGGFESPQRSRAERLSGIQQVAMTLRHLPIPVVAAVQGRLAGLGFALTQHCDRTVAALESYLGPVDPLRGLFPVAGSCVAMAHRVAQVLGGAEGGALIRRYARLIGRTGLSGSALDARCLALLRPADLVVFNPYELLHVARSHARALADSGYRVPGDRLAVAGAEAAVGIAEYLQSETAESRLDPAQLRRACLAARVLCGGEAAAGEWLPEERLLALEHEAWMTLLERSDAQ